MSIKGLLRKAGIASDGVDVDIFGGSLTARNIIGKQGKIIYFDPTDGDNTFTGRTPGTAVADIATGEAKLTAGQNDVLVYLAGTTSGYIVDTLDWDKDYTHLVGLSAPIGSSNRARLFNSGNTTGGSNLLNISAKGCIFKNLRIFQGSAIATAFCGEVSGDYNHFENVHFEGMGNATPAGNSTNYSLKLDGASYLEFHHCSFGGTSTKRTADNTVLLLDSVSSQLEFYRCRFLSWAETNTYPMVKLADSAGLENYAWFKDCLFFNRWRQNATNLLEVFEIPDMTGNKHANIVLSGDTCAIGFAEWATGDRGVIWVLGAAPAAGSAGVGSSGVPVQPT